MREQSGSQVELLPRMYKGSQLRQVVRLQVEQFDQVYQQRKQSVPLNW